MTIDLGGIKFDDIELFKQLKSDLKDDWFPDPLTYDDMLHGDLLVRGINGNFELNHGEYIPSQRTVLNLPKSNFTLRCALETSLSDRVLYHGLASFLIPFFDKHLPWSVFSHRYNYLKPDRRYMFRRAIPSWQDFTGTVRSAIADDKVLLSTDISNYFENISLIILKKSFLELIPHIDATSSQKSAIRAHIEMLFVCLKSWAHEPDKGIPQNRDASSFLANIYMRKVDKAMLDRGYFYFRYMDDIKIVCNDNFHARKALKDLSLALRDVALSINSKKTVIVPGNDAKKIKECLDTGTPDIQRIDTLWRTRVPSIVLRLVPEIKRLALKLIGDGLTDSKDFRFCINKLTFMALCEDLLVPPEFFAEITPKIVKAVVDQPASTDQYVRYLLAVDTKDEVLAELAKYLRDGVRNIYTWQSYRLWCLLAQKNYKEPILLDYAKGVVASSSDNPNRAGATMYIGTVGTEDQKIEVAKQFKTVKTFLGQRSALIAMHELPYGRCIEPHVKGFVRPDLIGVYHKLNSKRRGSYFSPVEKIPLSKAMDFEREYE